MRYKVLITNKHAYTAVFFTEFEEDAIELKNKLELLPGIQVVIKDTRPSGANKLFLQKVIVETEKA